MNPLTVIVVALTLVCITGCTKPAANGDVFIVTEGRENVKLGLVSIKAAKEDRVSKCISEVNAANLDSKKATLQSGPEFDEANLKLEQAKAELHSLEMSFSNNGNLTAEEVDHRMLLRRSAQEKIRDAEWDLESLKTSNPEPTMVSYGKCFADMRSDAESITDADGKFRLTLPSTGKYAIIASATRKLPGLNRYGLEQSEFYSWFVWADFSAGEAKSITLSNNNLSGLYEPETSQPIPVY